MESREVVPRLVEASPEEALGDSLVVLIHGPRQSGKTTLARRVGARRRYGYFNLDDDVVRAAAEAGPVGFVADLPPRAILDEVQRVPSLFTALKVGADRDRAPGRFLLTGSANVLLAPRLADSLAGRMEIIRLFPFAQCEIEDRGRLMPRGRTRSAAEPAARGRGRANQSAVVPFNRKLVLHRWLVSCVRRGTLRPARPERRRLSLGGDGFRVQATGVALKPRTTAGVNGWSARGSGQASRRGGT